MSNTANTFSIPTTVSITAAGGAVTGFRVADSTTGQNLSLIPATTSGVLGPFTRPGDFQIAAVGSAPGNTNLTIMPYSNNTVGIRLTDTSVLIGAGGSASFTPSSNIFFSGTTVSVTGNMSMNNSQINNCAALTSIDSGGGGITLSNSVNNAGGMVIQNANTASNLFYRQYGTARSHIFQTNFNVTTNLTLSNTENTSGLPFICNKQIAYIPGSVITATGSLSLPLNSMYFITAAGAITVTLPTNISAYAGTLIIFRRTTAGGIITVDQAGGASSLQAAGSTTTATNVSIAAATVTFEFISNGTLWCQL